MISEALFRKRWFDKPSHLDALLRYLARSSVSVHARIHIYNLQDEYCFPW